MTLRNWKIEEEEAFSWWRCTILKQAGSKGDLRNGVCWLGCFFVRREGYGLGSSVELLIDSRLIYFSNEWCSFIIIFLTYSSTWLKHHVVGVTWLVGVTSRCMVMEWIELSNVRVRSTNKLSFHILSVARELSHATDVSSSYTRGWVSTNKYDI